MLDAFEEIAASIEFAPPRIGLVSNVTGALAGSEIADAVYWRKHVRAPVRFADAVAALHAEGCNAFLEIGPAPTLVGMARRCLPSAEALWLPSLRSGRPDTQQLLETLALLYTRGADANWRAVERDEGQRRIPLPTYPFQRQRYWADFPKPVRASELPKLHPLLEERLRSPLLAGTVFQSRLRVDAPAYLNDHRIFDAPLFPATAFLEIALAAAQQAFGSVDALEAVQIRDALVLPESGEVTLQVALSKLEAGVASVEIFSQQEGDADAWKLHAAGQIRAEGSAVASVADAASLDEVRARCTEEFRVADLYERLAELGVDYGASFRGLREVWRRDGEALARVALPDETAREAGDYQLHPALLDACVQLLGAAVPGASAADGTGDVYVPMEIGEYHLRRAGLPALWCQALVKQPEPEGEVLVGELRLLDPSGALVAEIGGVHLKRTSRAGIERLRGTISAERLNDWLYTLEWERAEAAQPRSEWAAGKWLIFADRGDVGAALALRIEAAGGFCILVRAADLDLTDPAIFARFFDAVSGNGHGPLRGAIHLWSLDAPADADADSDGILEHQRRVCGSTLSLVQALVASGTEGARVYLATRGAQAVATDVGTVSPQQAPLWGLANTVSAEHPELTCVCIDLDSDARLDAPAALAIELAAGDGEDRIAWRSGGRYVARLARYSATAAAPSAATDAPVELDVGARGILDNLVLRTAKRRLPAAGEIEVRVRASGLNFRDVLNALGMYPGDAGPLGSECAGTVVAVGEGVSGFSVGDEVLAMAGGTFRSHVVAAAHMVYPKPPALSFAEAASVPIAFLTAYY
ncbi:MAG TPA: polyketide synthase dehydratase domain-containing protein, partial [Longimicrobiaceae bacterium]|nr:polyketide synthase dehydratase domain-containing protein [Longimicrobiaceae bacterium]